MNNQNSLKSITQKWLFAALILLLLPGFASASGTLLPAADLKATTKPVQEVKIPHPNDGKPLSDVKIQKSPLQQRGVRSLTPQKAKPALKRAEAAAKPSQGIQFKKSPLQQRGVRPLNPQNFKPVSRTTGMTADSLRDARVQKSPLQRQGTTLLDPQNTRPVLRRAEITRLWIGTESDGRWYWEATIKNTGNVELDGQDVVVQGYKIRVPQTSNTWTAASGSIIGPENLLPDQSRTIKRYWARCCKTGLLKVDLRDSANNILFDTETSNALAAMQGVPMAVGVTRIEWNDTTKTWQATLQNVTDYTLKFVVQGYLRHAGLLTPAGGSTVTLGPGGEASAMWLHATNAQHGDVLRVHIRCIMDHCNDSLEDCGFYENRWYKYIVIPNSEPLYSQN